MARFDQLPPLRTGKGPEKKKGSRNGGKKPREERMKP